MKDQDHLQMVEAAYAAFIDSYAAKILDCCAEDIHWIYPRSDTLGSAAGEFSGHIGVEEFFELFNEAESIRQFEPREFLHHGDRIIVFGHCCSYIKSKHRNFETDFVHIFTIRDGKITRFENFFDTAAELEAYRTRYSRNSVKGVVICQCSVRVTDLRLEGIVIFAIIRAVSRNWATTGCTVSRMHGRECSH